jgi:hypothetical protein
MAQKNSTKKTQENPMTVDELAGIIATSFNDVHERFNKIDGWFDAMGRRLDTTDKTLEEIAFFMTGHGRRIEILEDRVRLLATKLGIDFRQS